MGIIKLKGIAHAKEKLKQTISPKHNDRVSSSSCIDVPKGHFAVYVGESNTRFVVPISYLNHPLFQDLLNWVEEEFGHSRSTGALTIPCTEDYFSSLVTLINSSVS